MQILDEGHRYQIENRYGNTSQEIRFAKCLPCNERKLEYDGIYSQDLMHVLLDRLTWQIKNETDGANVFRFVARLAVRLALLVMDERCSHLRLTWCFG